MTDSSLAASSRAAIISLYICQDKRRNSHHQAVSASPFKTDFTRLLKLFSKHNTFFDCLCEDFYGHNNLKKTQV